MRSVCLLFSPNVALLFSFRPEIRIKPLSQLSWPCVSEYFSFFSYFDPRGGKRPCAHILTGALVFCHSRPCSQHTLAFFSPPLEYGSDLFVRGLVASFRLCLPCCISPSSLSFSFLSVFLSLRFSSSQSRVSRLVLSFSIRMFLFIDTRGVLTRGRQCTGEC